VEAKDLVLLQFEVSEEASRDHLNVLEDLNDQGTRNDTQKESLKDK